MGPLSISVSELRAAVVDPDWRARFMAGERPPVRRFSPPGTTTVHGTRFHAMARQLVDDLIAEKIRFSAEPDEIFRALHEAEPGRFIQRLLDRGEIDSAAVLTDALHALVERMTQLRERLAGAGRWRDLFVAQEFRVADVQYATRKRLIFISGILDGLRRHPSGDFEIVEYKMTQGERLPEEFIQVSLYQFLLGCRNDGLRCRGCLEYFHPRLHVVDIEPRELTEAFDGLVRPVLEELGEQASARHPPAVNPGLERSSGQLAAGHLARTRTAPMSLDVGTRRSAPAVPVRLPVSSLLRHTGILGGSGSGKTTLALGMLERLLSAGVPALLVDRKGDLCRYAAPELVQEEPRLRDLLGRVRVSLYTPGHSGGRPLGIALVPPGVSQLESTERQQAYRNAALGLGSMMGLKSSPNDRARIAVLVRALQTFTELRPEAALTLPLLIRLVTEEDTALLDGMGAMDPKHLKWLGQALQTLDIMQGELFAEHREVLCAERLLGLEPRPEDGRTQLSIVSTKFLGDESTAVFWVAQLLLELQRFASRSPRTDLQAVVMLDEADLYLPAVGKPATKEPMESLLKRARSAGLGIMLLSQSPGDFDYKSRENIRTWFLGLVKQKPALEKLRPVLAEADIDATAVLPKQKVGQFFLVSEREAVPVMARRSLVQPEQLSESEILRLARVAAR